MTPKLVIFYKSKTTGPDHSPYQAGGLAANAMHTVGVLRREGVDVDLKAVKDFSEILEHLAGGRFITHVVIEAVWVTPEQVKHLASSYPNLKIVVRAHSKIGFLQVEPEAIPVMRELVSMHKNWPNVFFSSNNEEFCRALREVYGPVLYLPNLYDFADSFPRTPARPAPWPLRVASFGASRLLKLHPCAALAAMQLARAEKRDLEFYINSDKTPGGESVKNTVRNLLRDLSWAKLVEVPWQDTHTFKQTIASMDLVFQLSSTETFCLVAADAVASGVPVVVGEAITWVPKRYQVNPDNTSEACAAAIQALSQGRRTLDNQRDALEYFVNQARRVWMDFLEPPKKRDKGFLWIF